MRILNEEAAKKLNYSSIIMEKRALHPKPPQDPNKIKIIYQKASTTADTPESFLTVR